MTEQDRTAIITMRENGASFSAIARTLDVPLGTVKTVCTRGQKTNTFTGTFCLNCGTPIRNSLQGKRFCSRHCYNKWWHANHSVRTLYHQTCPVCGKPMIKRMAKKGVNSGKEFWSCSSYPECNGTRKI